jgi:hypothetical protein
VFGSRVLRKRFALKSDEVRGKWSRLHEELLRSSQLTMIKPTIMRWAGHVTRMGEMTGSCRILVGRPEGKRPLGSPRSRLEDNIKVDLHEVGGIGAWNGLIWLRIGRDGLLL